MKRETSDASAPEPTAGGIGAPAPPRRSGLEAGGVVILLAA